MKSKLFISAVTLLLIAGGLMAQPGWNWPEDPDMQSKAQEKNALYTDNYKQGNYRRAADHLSWLLINAPDLNNSIYINGAKIYDELADGESDEAKKAVFQDSSMMMFDLRTQHFNEESKVINRKAFTAYKYWRNDASKYKEMYDLFSKAFESDGEEFWTSNVVAYMDAIRRYKLSSGALTDEQVLSHYDKISAYLKGHIEKNPSDKRLGVIQDQLDKLLVATVDVSCDFIANTLGPKYLADPENLGTAKNIIKLSFASKCLDLEVFLEAVKFVQSKEPEYGLALLIGVKSTEKEDYETALAYYKEAISLTDDNTKKADCYKSISDIHNKNGRKSLTRENALKMVEVDPSRKDAYTIIGNLYMGSYNECRKNENPVNDRAVFMAAYEMYRRAGNQQGMSSAQQQFPSMEEIFTYNMEVGQQINTGCWVNETVTIQKR
ncbi:MAG: tetratricopeptide repeat protein [Cyclobacteriaceae bacterium]